MIFGSLQYPLLEKTLRSKVFEDFEKLLRPFLTPTNKLSEIKIWNENNYFKTWVRRIYLESKFKNDESYQNALKKLNRIEKLKTWEELTDVFGDIKTWKRDNWNDEKVDERMANLLKDFVKKDNNDNSQKDKDKNIVKVDENYPIDHWTVEDILEVGGCSVYNKGPFNLFCEKHNVYDYYCQEYIESLLSYLNDRANGICIAEGKDQIKVLEIGAGNGYLGSFLNLCHLQRLEKDQDNNNDINITWRKKFDYISTDFKPGKMHTFFYSSFLMKYELLVQKYEYKAAIDKFQPDIVLCAWMPMGVDWSEYIRSKSCVKEYILLGETDRGCCGHNYYTCKYGNII